ncbi:DctP family TRAP transporter solute-binding subunit [Peribacillus frigoritolerans]|uniref:DctP family TRAP transporter solute-binding subunit n=1 Tax=Peribacillus frigoritolerans TaxID=450367 RepID=UPI002E1CDE70|nr:DctP family TRAP transporter solute-binding subunit [Peribacillus frigoritolerans]MED3835277.1 DctP family TRAP transporter solute-binding subunit [Peribacillus frigoritolerans]MED3845628.1 DctP family TRAP transporter solute-binding subunit [Peribacillus frigoritolerans]WVN11897.1 DctP family TRAP transporter solute-binding subunit [Peribacillus frigoritolerans]
MKNILTVFVSVILVGVMVGCQSVGTVASNEKGNHNLKMSITVSESSTWYLGAEHFSKEVAEKTDGRIKIKLYANEQLSAGDPAKGVEMLLKGSTDLSYHSPIIYSVFEKRLGVITAPFLFKNLDEADEKMHGEGGEALKEILSENGIEPLGFGESGFRQVTNNVRPIRNPEDIEDLKVRIPGIKMYMDLWRELDADPTAMAFSEVFTGLQQGTIDGQENPIDVIKSSKLEEVQKYISIWNYSYDPLILGMNKEKFDSIHPDDQKIIKIAAENANKYQIKISREKEKQQMRELKASGMEFVYPTDDEIEVFRKASEKIYDNYESEWGSDLLDTFRK